jgi:hypothetical protein
MSARSAARSAHVTLARAARISSTVTMSTAGIRSTLDAAPAVALHVLGAADLGVEPAGYEAALAAFLAAGPGERRRLLLRSRPEAHHESAPPLQSLLLHARESVGRVALLATDQRALPEDDPRRRKDTAPLARAVVDVLAGQPDLYGSPLAAHVVTLPSISVADVAGAVERWAKALPAGTPLVTAVAGGAIEAFLGVLLGCAAAGEPPTIYAANRQDAPPGAPYGLRLETGLQPWLVRSGAFEPMIELDPAHAAEWEVLAALGRFDWRRAAEAARRAPGFAAAIGMPAGIGSGAQPRDPATWAWLRSLLSAFVLRGVGAGDTWRLLPGHQWIELMCRELWATDELWTPAERAYFRGAVVKETVAEMRRGRRGEGEVVAEPRFEDCDFEAFVKSWRRHLAHVPEPVADALRGRRWERLWRLSKKVGHEPPDVPAGDAVAAVRFLDVPGRVDPVALGLSELGWAPGPSLPGAGCLVLACAGMRDVTEDGGTPMLDAIAAGLWRTRPRLPRESSHLRLLVSPETLAAGETVRERARRLGFASSELLGPVSAADFAAARDRTLEALRTDPRLDAVRLVVLASNPGTKAMNAGAVVAGVQFAFATWRPAVLAPVQHRRDGSRVDVDQGMRGRIPARLAHDDQVGPAVRRAIDHLDIDLALEVLRRGSARWDGPAEEVRAFLRGVQGTRDEAEADRRLRFPARAELLRHRVPFDPWGAIHRYAALAEHAWADGAWRGARLPRNRQIWDWRNSGPLGHRFWRTVPIRDVDLAMDRAAAELVDQGLVPAGQDRRALVTTWNRLRRRAQAGWADHPLKPR